MALLNSDNLKELSICVEKLTHTGQKILDPVLLKRIKSICRLSEQYIDHVYHLVTHQLDKNHAEVRYSSFQICDELFRRSHHFRELIVGNMKHLMEVTAETSPDHPLPPPRSVALDLKRLALGTIENWNKEFGEGYKKLQIGFNFLKHYKKVDFNALNNESLAEQARIREREQRQNVVNQSNLRKVTAEIEEMLPEINNTIIGMQNCISLLLPMPEDFFIPEESSDTPALLTNLDQPSTSSTVTCPKVAFKKGVNNRIDSKCEESDSAAESDNNSEELNLREHGMLSARHTISVNIDLNISNLKRTADNSAIFDNARDLFILLQNRYLPCVKKWIQITSKASEFAPSGQLKKVMDLKKLMENAISKCDQLKLQRSPQEYDGSSSDSEFEEVEEKEGYEKYVREELPILMSPVEDDPESIINSRPTTKNKTNLSICSLENDKNDPTTSQSTIAAMTANIMPSTIDIKSKSVSKEKQSANGETNKEAHSFNCKLELKSSTSQDTKNSRKSKLLTVAPKLPFDLDLYHWEDEKVPIPTMLAVRAEGSQIWSARPSEGLDEIPVPEDMASSLRTRVIEYSGKFQPVKLACRAVLSNGKLCPRKDRYKCPFHGKIVPRDETGHCSNPEDAMKLQHQVEEEQAKTPDWQDPQLLAEIKAATGIDLKMPEKGKRKKKKTKNQYPGLTDLKAKQNTPHNRLAKKVFKKSAMKRISKALDTQDHKRFRDKYGDQFHYMYNTA